MSGWDGRYAELGAMTNFSFLEGASHPGEIMIQARALGLAAVGVADRNTLAGIVRALMAAERDDIRLVLGQCFYRTGTILAFGHDAQRRPRAVQRFHQGLPQQGFVLGHDAGTCLSHAGGLRW